MDIHLLLIYSLSIYGIVVLDSYANARETFPTYNPGDKEVRGNVQHHKRDFYKFTPRNKLFRSLLPIFKGPNSHGPENQKIYPKLVGNMNAYDLLQDSPGNSDSFVCPEGYKKRIVDGAEFCSPTKTEHEIAETDPQCSDGQFYSDPRCKVAEQISGPITCQNGSVRVQIKGKAVCVDQASVTECAKGTRLINTGSSWICEPISIYKQPELDPAKNKLPFKLHHAMGLKAGPKVFKEPAGKPSCEKGKVAAMSHNGYICVDPIFPPSVCPDDEVPSMTSLGIECLPCPYGQKVVHVEGGVKCEIDKSAMTEIACPEGLQHVQTSVGRICQYIPTSKARPVQNCSEGQRAEVTDEQVSCIPVRSCPSGQIEVKSYNGDSKCVMPNLTDASSCISGEVFYKGACISIGLAEKFDGNYSIPCKSGEFLFVTNSGSVCQPITEEYMIEAQRSTSCEPNAIITQTSGGFRCLHGEIPLRVIPLCDHDFIIAKLGDVYECISIYDADLTCQMGEQMVRVENGFICKRATQEVLCGLNEFQHSDENGQLTCISHLEASDMCGDGYMAFKRNEGFICRQLVQDVSCPAGFVLSLDNGHPMCIEEGVDCYGITEVNSAGCLNLEPHCDPGYKITLDFDTPHCALEATIDLEQPPISGTDVEPCDTDGRLRPCDLPADVLLAGCNPDCANGGTCVNSSCVCPPGITGHACHIDVNECDSRPCEYRCENIFGSYQCACPTGMFLSTDGRTCTDAGCIPECLNNGECARGQCRCKNGFEGKYCQIDKDECLMYGERLCQHRCRNTYGGYTCICPPGSRLNQDGRTCLNTTCIPECRNGGSCRSHRCHCPPGFYGIICQFDVNECRRGKPCENNCHNSWGSYSCSCNDGFILHTDGRTCIPA